MNRNRLDNMLDGIGWIHDDSVFAPPPEKAAPVETLQEARDMNDQISSISDRLDQFEADSRSEVTRQNKRFLVSFVLNILSLLCAAVAAAAAVWTVFHPSGF